MKKLRIALAGFVLALMFGATPAFAYSSGLYTDSNGLGCTWTSFIDSMISTSCSGYSFKLGGWLSYSCDITVIGVFADYTCRTSTGYSWSGTLN